MAQDAPKTAQDGDRACQDGAKTGQDGAKTGQDGVRTSFVISKDCGRSAKDSPVKGELGIDVPRGTGG